MFFMRGGVHFIGGAHCVQFHSIVLFSTNKIKITHKKHSPTSQRIESADIHIVQVSAHA